MPPVSDKQAAAMHAAAEGHSTLGIPQSVGKEFVGAPAAQPHSSIFEDLANQRVRRLPRGLRGSKGKKGGHAAVHEHLKNAKNATTTDEKRGHVFKALTELNNTRRAEGKSATDQAMPELF